MKKAIFFLAAVLTLSGLFSVAAQIETPTATPAQEAEEDKPSTATGELDEKVKILKEKIATKVAELREENKKVTAGRIIKTDDGSLEIKIREEKVYKVTFDETLTTVYSISGATKDEIEFADLKEGDFVIVSGSAVEDNISANFIYKDTEYMVTSGKVVRVNQSDFSVEVITAEKNNYILDIETSTKQRILDIDTFNLSPAGFSKFKEGDTIHFVTEKQTEKEATRSSALRLLIIPQEYFIQENSEK